ncbi:MAG TPA: hypothetical protein VJB12_05385 [Candidatus Nanoarchaeia archaeon]|nr:hypothetical protein [Candidatus Nanoarchaeia archaeon]
MGLNKWLREKVSSEYGIIEQIVEALDPTGLYWDPTGDAEALKGTAEQIYFKEIDWIKITGHQLGPGEYTPLWQNRPIPLDYPKPAVAKNITVPAKKLFVTIDTTGSLYNGRSVRRVVTREEAQGSIYKNQVETLSFDVTLTGKLVFSKVEHVHYIG